MTPATLVDYLEASAARWPARTAVVAPDGTPLTYAELNDRADRIAAFLIDRAVRQGDRIGVVLPKGLAAVVALFGIMKAGAAYVPIDYSSPAERIRRILEDCGVRALFIDARALDGVPHCELAAVVVSGDVHAPMSTEGLLWPFQRVLESGPAHTRPTLSASNLAYILYTSGSTGVPKGVLLTHQNAVSFVEWCSSVFAPAEDDRFSSHAPFHFDLSVLDLYLSIKHGASLYLVSEELGRTPRELARFIAANRLTFWYSTPSILSLLVQFGNLGAHPVPSLRMVLFAGEVFPIKHLRALKRAWPHPIFYNLYGPTETNVCTFARIPDEIPDDRDRPYPIGFLCAHCRGRVLDDRGREVEAGEEGLLYISGPSVFQGYWNRPTENAAAFREADGAQWYNTGDVVRWSDEEGFIYAGRRDRMVKRRGYRIELGEIERALYKHPRVREAAVVSVPDPDASVAIVAFVSCHGCEAPSIVDLKTFCAGQLPGYMIPDRFQFRDVLPKTSTDKTDYQSLRLPLLDAVAAH